MALFERGDAGHALGAGLGGIFATLPQHAERFLSGGDLLLELSPSLFQRGDLRLPRRDDGFLIGPLGGKALQFGLRNAHAFGDAGHFGIELLQHVAGSQRLMFGFALFAIEALQQGSEVLDFSAECEHAHLFVAQCAFQIFELAENFAQLALHGKRAFGALFAAGDRDIVKALARLR